MSSVLIIFNLHYSFLNIQALWIYFNTIAIRVTETYSSAWIFIKNFVCYDHPFFKLILYCPYYIALFFQICHSKHMTLNSVTVKIYYCWTDLFVISWLYIDLEMLTEIDYETVMKFFSKQLVRLFIFYQQAWPRQKEGGEATTTSARYCILPHGGFSSTAGQPDSPGGFFSTAGQPDSLLTSLSRPVTTHVP